MRLQAAPLLVALALCVTAAGAAPRKARRPAPPPRPVPLVWHVETLDGRVVETRDSEAPINPASVVKAATTLWALEALGPDHRFETRFSARGKVDAAGGVLHGDLVVRGSADPDFHLENAWLVARTLNDRGIREVRGNLVVDERFWLGWEGGSDRPVKDPARRAALMAARLREALDPARWSPATKRAMAQFTARRGLTRVKSPRVRVTGAALAAGPELARAELAPLVIHRSNPLPRMLKRFNAYSNNDIERFEASLGPPESLARRIADLAGAEPEDVTLKTLSGLGSNRLTARQVVSMLRGLRESCARFGLRLGDVLPVVGCDPGTLTGLRQLQPARGAIAAKTGTLTATDGGVAVLAGLASTQQGERVFCVAAPGSGSQLHRARTEEQAWLMGVIGQAGGPKPGSCGLPVGHPDDLAEALFLDVGDLAAAGTK